MGNININGKTAVHAKSDGKLITTDVCLTPPFCVPIPYTNQAESKMTDLGASSVNIQGSPACNSKSNFKISQGDAPGACAGASSGSIGQMAEFITFSNDVMIEGKPAVRNNDKMVSNLKNTAPQPLMQPPAGNAPAGTAKAPPAAENEYSQTINFAGMIGRDVDSGQLLARMPYEAYTDKGEPIPGGSGMLSKEGLTDPIFTPQAEKIKVVLGGDGKWLKFGDVVHDAGSGGEGEQSSESANQLNMRFLGVDGEPIKGLECKVCIGDKTESHTTDDEGLLPAITVDSESKLELSVKKFDGSYKVIDTTTVTPSHATLEYVSPKIVVEVKTEKHKGDPGSAESQAPKPTAQDRGDKPMAPKKAKETPKNISGKKPVKKEDALKSGRNKDGNPQVTFTQKITDWWNSWRLPSMNLWNVSAAPMSLAKNGESQPGPKGDADAIKKVEKMIEYLENQADYLYAKGEGTVAVLTAMTNGTFKHEHGEKKKDDGTIGKCYQYVKVALVSKQWVANATALDGESASSAGPKLLAAGFTDVTDTIPDSRWAAPGDVTVYKWTAEHWAYVRSKPHKSDSANHGHIDIRSYDNYLTDFIPPRNQPNWDHYENPRVYRLYYDPVPILRMKAFLSCIREYEGQEEKNEAKRYQILNTPLPDSKDKYFSSFNTHPWEAVPKEKRGIKTAAGAYQIVYITWDELLTGRDLKGKIVSRRKMFSLGNSEKKFTPELQDRMAVAILEEREALGFVRKGEIEKAVDKLKGTWSSFPGGKENVKRITADKRPMNMAYFKELYDRYLTEEKKKAGIK